MSFQNIPSELKRLDQWVNWRLVSTSEGKSTKQPLRSRDGKLASVTDPLDWGSFDAAVLAAVHCNGIGFVFTRSDPYCGIDLDDPKGDAEKLRRNNDIIRLLYGTYMEISPSGSGIHIICRGKLPGKGRRAGSIEIYDDKRFFTMTGVLLLASYQ